MTNVYFVRHAQPNYSNHDDLTRELTEKGLEERKLVTAFLQDKDIHAVFSSPFRRSVDTVKDFADKHGLVITLIEDFRERRIDSEWIEDFESFARHQWEDFSYKLSDGECLGEVQERNIRALRDVMAANEGKNMVIGSHGTALSTVINYFDPTFGYEEFEAIRKLMPWVVHFSFENGECVSIEKIDLFQQRSL